MEDACPGWPQLGRRAMRVIVHVNVVAAAHLGVAMCKLVDVACEMVVTDHLVQGVTVTNWIVRIRPVCVLEDDGLTSDAVGERIQLLDRLQELLSIDVDILFFGKQIVKVVEDEEVALFRVTAHHDVTLFKVACC